MTAPIFGPRAQRAALKAILAAPPEGVECFPADDRKRWLAMRERDVTASVAAALFGAIHPYRTAYQLWADKCGFSADGGGDNAAMRRGRLLEPVALQILVEDHPTWGVVSPGLYYRNPRTRIGATPDVLVVDPAREGFGVVQVKTVPESKFRAEWCDEDGQITAPLWIAVQASIEAALTGAARAAVLPLRITQEFSIEYDLIDVPLKPALMDRLGVLVADFWRRVAERRGYDPDFGRDAAAIAAVQGEGDGMEADLTGDVRVAELLEQYDALRARASEARVAQKALVPVVAELRQRMGNASSALAHGERVLEIAVRQRRATFTEASESTSLHVRRLRRVHEDLDLDAAF
jgi:hypothetical protein